MSNAYALRRGTDGAPDRSFARWARPALVTLTALCALVLLARFVGEPLTRISRVSVQSDIPLADDQVLALSGLSGGEHWYDLSTALVERRLEASPLVRRAKVQKAFPNSLRLTVWGRQPAALILAQSGGRVIPVLVDGEGVVFKIGTTATEVDLPVVSGLSAGSIALGARLPREYAGLFADLQALRDRAPALFAQVSEVSVPAGTASAELVLYLTSAGVPIRVRGSIDDVLVKNALMVADLLSRQGVLKDIQELDFRSGDVVYTTRAQAAR